MAKDNLLKSEDFTEQDILDGVHKSLEGMIQPGKKIPGMRIFYEASSLLKPKHDVIFFWRTLYVSCVDEYEFAIKVFGDWSIYLKFCKTSAPFRNDFKPLWENERERKCRSKAMGNVISAVEQGDVKESKWLEKHILDTTTKEELPKKKKDTKKIMEETKPEDDIMDDIESNYRNMN